MWLTSRSPRDGRFIEEIGYYDPMTEPAEHQDRRREGAKYWLKIGAQPTDTVRVLLKKGGVHRGLSIMEELVGYVARSLVDNTDAVTVAGDRRRPRQRSIIELRVAPEDMGKVIGKQGRIAKAIRAVVRAATAKDAKPVFVEIQ